jgi:L-alanine-DL-glutamate epimerase-like enolase superfamily enzyme
MTVNRGNSVPVEEVKVSTFTVPTDSPESDGTLKWDKTTMVMVHVEAGGKQGLGYTYADKATAEVIGGKLAKVVKGQDAMAPPSVYMQMWHAIRNLGRPGIVSTAISAVDCALWDLKAKLLDLPLVTLLGQVHKAAPIYGSGGFTSYSDERLAEQLGGWAAQEIRFVKMKVGRDAHRDIERLRVARQAIGPKIGLFVDANGAYSRKLALAQAEVFAHDYGVSWFEEPVSSDDLEGLHLIRDRAPASMDVAAGEYGYEIFYFHRMLHAGTVDVLQADITRCGGVTGFLQVAALCQANNLPMSAHTAPAQHIHVCCAAVPLRNLEYFHDHVRIERMLLEGVPEPVNGELFPDLSRPGMGIELKQADARRYAA